MKCPTCKLPFEGPAAVKLGEIGLPKTSGPERAATLTNLASAYGRLGRPVKMRELLEDALAINEVHYGPESSIVAVTLTNLSYAYSDLGDAWRSRELLQRALEVMEREFGADHKQVFRLSAECVFSTLSWVSMDFLRLEVVLFLAWLAG